MVRKYTDGQRHDLPPHCRAVRTPVMTNPLEEKYLSRFGLATGIFLAWSVAFVALGEPARAIAEFLVLIPVAVAAVSHGVRGGLIGSSAGVLGIGLYQMLTESGPATHLLPGGSLAGVAVVFGVGAILGYGRTLKNRRATASQIATSAQARLKRLDTESRHLLRLAIEIGNSTTAESIASSANVALSGVVAFDRIALYLLDHTRGTAKVNFVSGGDGVGPVKGDEFLLEEIMATDPFGSTQLAAGEPDPPGECRIRPMLIFQRSINDGAEPVALLRLWSNTERTLSWREKKYTRSVAAQITPALKRAILQSELEKDARVNAVVAEFAKVTHRNLRVTAVVDAAARQIGRDLDASHVAVAVSDLDGRRITVRQGTGKGVSGFGISGIRTLAEAVADPLADCQPRVISVEECQAMAQVSEVASALARSGLGSFIVLNPRGEGELIAQFWIGFKKGRVVSTDHFEYVTRVGDHLASALVNARKSERSQELQRQLVGQNEKFAYVQDVLERAEAELSTSNQKLAALSESKSQFMSAVAHELKTPITIILGYIDLLCSSPAQLDREQREFIDHMGASVQRLRGLAEDLGDVSKMESGGFSISKRPHDICAVMKSVVEDLEITASNLNRRIEYTATSAVQMIDGDPVRLAQVFTNLITNALKYSSDDRPVEVIVASGPSGLKVVVTDYGLGMSKTDQENLFVPFFRSTNPEVLNRTGTGLGLVLAKSIVEEHGGNLSVSSKLGSGSTFTVELPVRVNVVEALSA